MPLFGQPRVQQALGHVVRGLARPSDGLQRAPGQDVPDRRRPQDHDEPAGDEDAAKLVQVAPKRGLGEDEVQPGARWADRTPDEEERLRRGPPGGRLGDSLVGEPSPPDKRAQRGGDGRIEPGVGGHEPSVGLQHGVGARVLHARQETGGLGRQPERGGAGQVDVDEMAGSGQGIAQARGSDQEERTSGEGAGRDARDENEGDGEAPSEPPGGDVAPGHDRRSSRPGRDGSRPPARSSRTAGWRDRPRSSLGGAGPPRRPFGNRPGSRSSTPVRAASLA